MNPKLKITQVTVKTPHPGIHPVAVVCGFDRITFAIDRTYLPGPVAEVQAGCGAELRMYPERMLFNPVYQCRIELPQPTNEAIAVLVKKCLGHDVSALLTYAEIACDFIFQNHSQAKDFETWLAGQLVVCHQRELVQVFKQQYYFGRRANSEGSRRGVVGTMYADMPSKLISRLSGQPCAHLEIRLTGSATLSEAGLGSVSDLIDFDHARFWESAVKFYLPPNPTNLGRVLGSANGPPVSGSALRKRANKFTQECSVKGAFFMHNAVRKNKMLARKLTEISVAEVMQLSQAIYL